MALKLKRKTDEDLFQETTMTFGEHLEELRWKLVKSLLANKFQGWNATISFSRGEGPYWQQWTPPMLLMQYTKPDMPFTEAKIIFPPEFKTGDLVVPK